MAVFVILEKAKWFQIILPGRGSAFTLKRLNIEAGVFSQWTLFQATKSSDIFEKIEYQVWAS